MRHLLGVQDLSRGEILGVIRLAQVVKRSPRKFKSALYEQVLLTFFAAPSLRTELSFDSAMFQMGGEVIDYHAETSPWASGKESLEDVARVVSRYCNAIMIRMHEHTDVLKFARFCSIPVINGLTSVEHPCQVLGDLLTIVEKKRSLKNLKVAYVGDGNNNVTHSLMFAAQKLGLEMSVACPHTKEFLPREEVVTYCKQVTITPSVARTVENADVVYTDSWMSYQIPKSEHARRVKILKPFQITEKVMKYAKRNAIFMHCLPALRGEEVTKEVIDGKQSVVFDQAENRLHIQKAILLTLLKGRKI